MTWRELWVYLVGFPDDSRTKTALRADREMPKPWTFTDGLLARIGNEISYQTYVLKRAHGYANTQDAPPQPLLPDGVATVTDLPTERRARQQLSYLKRLEANKGSLN